MGDNTDKTEDREGPAGNLPGYVTMGEDRRIKEAYRDWVNYNNGAHLSAGVKDDQA